jgi:GNAT superfamily N-acetyltransferase
VELEIRALSPELLDDYLHFFDYVAFADHKEWSQCYCVHFHWNEALEAEYKAYAAAGGSNFGREQACKLVQNGVIQGYLAYRQGAVVGWCNANDKGKYAALAKEKAPEIWEDDARSEGVKSIVCFLIAPELRGKGIASALLARVCAEAQTAGYRCIEAYPYTASADMYANHHGPWALYESHGFAVVKDLGQRAVVRKML